MRILKERSRYMENRVKYNLTLTVILLLVGSIAIFTIPFLTLTLFSISVYFYHKYTNLRKGIKGEDFVIETLRNLDDSYCLFNDVRLDNGNIDHIVLGSNGIFVIETKNYSGEITCNGDSWTQRKNLLEYDIRSPSKQLKYNAWKLKNILKNQKLWVNEILVFTNPDATLEMNNPTVNIVNPDELCKFIKARKSKIRLSQKELKEIEKIMLKLSSLESMRKEV